MDTVVDDLLAVDATLLLEVRIESRLDVVEDGLPATQMAQLEPLSRSHKRPVHADVPLIVVDEVTKTGGINNSQAESHTVLFDIFGNGKPRVRWQTERV